MLSTAADSRQARAKLTIPIRGFGAAGFAGSHPYTRKEPKVSGLFNSRNGYPNQGFTMLMAIWGPAFDTPSASASVTF
jgi:hypothetical protein